MKPTYTNTNILVKIHMVSDIKVPDAYKNILSGRNSDA
jgi:hypothetical protein